MLVHLIADYGAGDLAFAEVRQRLALALPGAHVHATPVAAFDTLAAGFCVAQLALTEGPSDRPVDDAPAPPGARVPLRIGPVSASAIVSDGTFAVAEGELALAPGSSGWLSRKGRRRAFYELFLRGGSAAQRFAGPSPGTRVCVEGIDGAPHDAHPGLA